jgi:hypothetical protein
MVTGVNRKRPFYFRKTAYDVAGATVQRARALLLPGRVPSGQDRALDPHDEFSCFIIRVQYVATRGTKKLGDGRHKTGAVGTIDQKNSGAQNNL